MELAETSQASPIPVYRLSTATAALDVATDSRGLLGSGPEENPALLEADEEVCLAARRAFTRFVDIVALGGRPNEVTTTKLHSALERAREAVRQTEYKGENPYLASVAEKLEQLEQISANARRSFDSLLESV